MPESVGGVIAFVAILLLVVAIVDFLLRTLHPTPERGQRLLRRWGVHEPSLEQGRMAATYLRSRRKIYVRTFILLAIGVTGVRAWAGDGGDTSQLLLVLISVIAGLLIGELITAIRPALRGRRSAVLIRRRVTDLVPAYGQLAFVGATLVASAAIVVNLAAASWARSAAEFLASADGRFTVNGHPSVGQTSAPPTDSGTVWLLLALVLIGIATWGTVWLGMMRGPLVEDSVVDAALRVRTARVSVGAGLLLLTPIASSVLMRIRELANPARDVRYDGFPEIPSWLVTADNAANSASIVTLVVCLVIWVALISPWRPSKLVEANR